MRCTDDAQGLSPLRRAGLREGQIQIVSDSTKFRRLGNEYVAGLDSRFESSKTCTADSRVISRTRCVFVQSQSVIETERDGQFRKSSNANQIDETVLVEG